MRGIAVFLFFAMMIAAWFAFSGGFAAHPVYYRPVIVIPFQYANFLFWILLLLFFMAVVLSASRRRRPLSPEMQAQQIKAVKAWEDAIIGGFSLALFLLVIAVILGMFGFGFVASSVAGLAFWIAIVVALVVAAMDMHDHRPRLH